MQAFALTYSDLIKSLRKEKYFMKLNLTFLLMVAFTLQCASSAKKDSSEGDGKLMESIIEKAQSEEGQKVIQSAKEQISDKENQEKVKGLLSKDKKK
jgi:hypothetical protein